MTAKEELRRVRSLNLELDSLEDEMAYLEASATRITPILSDMPMSHGDHDKIGNAVAKLLALKSRYNKKWDELIDERERIQSRIWSIEDRLYGKVLYHYYLRGETWEEVAVHCRCTLRHVHRIHGEALLAFEKTCH